MSERPPVAILGAGLAGLVAAHDLTKAGRDVTVFEAADGPGGLCRALDLGGRPVDCYYRHVFKSHGVVTGLVEELGLGGDLVWKTVRQGVVQAGTVRALDHPIHYLRSLAFSPAAVKRSVALAASLRRGVPVDLDRITAIEWLSAYETEQRIRSFWRPLLNKKFGSLAETVSASWLADRITARGSSKRVLLPGEVLGHLSGGFFRIVDALFEKCKRAGVSFRFDTRVTALKKEGSRIGAIATRGGEIPWNGLIVSTLPGSTLAGLLRNTVPKAVDCECVVVSFSAPLSKFYWLSNLDPAPFAAIIEQSHLAPEFGHLAYLPRYHVGGETERLRDDEAIDRAVAWLAELFPGFDPKQVRAGAVVRDARCQAVFEVDAPRPAPLPVNILSTDPTAGHADRSRTMNGTVCRARQVVRHLTQGGPVMPSTIPEPISTPRA